MIVGGIDAPELAFTWLIAFEICNTTSGFTIEEWQNFWR